MTGSFYFQTTLQNCVFSSFIIQAINSHYKHNASFAPIKTAQSSLLIDIIILFLEARKEKELTQQELADLSHVSIKQIAKIEKGKINPSYLILKALAKVLSISLDSLINPNVSPEDEGINQMKMFYSSCPLEMRKTLLRLTQETTRELTELSKNFETK